MRLPVISGWRMTVSLKNVNSDTQRARARPRMIPRVGMV